MSDPSDYTVGWICAIDTEYVAAQSFLDKEDDQPETLSPNDNNCYTLGEIGVHKVVIAVLPDGEYGTSSAASVARDMLHSFPNIRIGLMVGIGGGVPSRHDIRLGDIVVSASRDGEGSVFQYDFGKTVQGQSFCRTGFLNQPPTVLRTAVSGLRAQYERKGHQLEEVISNVLEKNKRMQKKYKRPDLDRLYPNHIIHPPDSKASCAETCDSTKLILRLKRTEDEDNPMIHYGLIASGNKLMKDALIRDKLTEEKDILCFEMEAAGLMNHFPCLVIRGICDYSDSHKSKEWQGYAAMAAAAYARDLLYQIIPQRVQGEKKISDILSSVKEAIVEVQKTTQDTNFIINEQNQREEHQAITRWLTPVDYGPQQSDFINRRHKGTGEWLLRSNEFQQWLKEGHQSLFCPGMPGAGKTIGTSVVIRYLQEKFEKDPTIGIAYLYCNFKQKDKQSLIDLILSLLKQLVQEQPSIPNIMKDLYSRHGPKRTRPLPDEILDAMRQVISSYSRTFIIVDALDECQVSYEGRGIFLQEIFSLQVKTGMNIFATSRFIPEIEKWFEKSIRLEIRASDSDIQKYLDGKLQNFQSSVSKNLSLRGEIKSKIAKAVEGMFLLAQLSVDSLAYKTTPKAIRLALRDLETETESLNDNDDKQFKALDRAYMEAMDRINAQSPEHRELARQVLSWITCAKRSLTCSELQHAIAVEMDERELDRENMTDIELIVSVCAGLVIIDEKCEIIRLIHYTTQEYFERTWRAWFPNAHTDITKTCATYLSFDTFESGFSPTHEAFQARLESNILYDYAARNWGHHARISSIEGGKLILDLLENRKKISACSQALMASDGFSRYSRIFNWKAEMITAIHLAAYFGLEKSMTALLDRQHDPNSKDYYGRTPLLWAVEGGHEAIVKLLLEKGADLESKDHEYGRTPLSRAAEGGHEAVVKLLLEKGADLESKDCEYGRTPLSWAVEGGHEVVVKLLLGKGADLESKDQKYGQTPLSWAAASQHEAVVKLLLAKGAKRQSYLDVSDMQFMAGRNNDMTMRSMQINMRKHMRLALRSVGTRRLPERK
ncbi:hypothetical protein BGW36DRAFT_70072 [Talaromyces proteolyticus]|uniref:Nucleoside phosphorylase domain-containing protein n=1 Tax=Talaromyces proteolyticus TaxID=1131652 RepID=A0AAD4PUF3_9EURO|nr:uncharacterized protein BGW36DRAFT_70072 [Talaromyces proteolyticus]KAH8689310.1 hypothetical protein BGW36DRAFT_70072 [Talaromyces proteolyticus]